MLLKSTFAITGMVKQNYHTAYCRLCTHSYTNTVTGGKKHRKKYITFESFTVLVGARYSVFSIIPGPKEDDEDGRHNAPSSKRLLKQMPWYFHKFFPLGYEEQKNNYLLFL